MNKMYKNRLLKMADFLEQLPNKLFDLRHFVAYRHELNETGVDHNYSNPTSDSLIKIGKDMKKHKCGAVACAIGWMPQIFPRSVEWGDGDVIQLKGVDKDGDQICGFRAAQEFLGLEIDASHNLFTVGYYGKTRRNPKNVARRIRKFVETGFISTRQYIDGV